MRGGDVLILVKLLLAFWILALGMVIGGLLWTVFGPDSRPIPESWWKIAPSNREYDPRGECDCIGECDIPEHQWG